MANQNFSLSSSLKVFSSIVCTKNSLLSNLKVKNKSVFDDTVTINNSFYIKGLQLIQSKNILSDDGFTIGETVNKDMDNNNYDDEFDPFNYQSSFFPDMNDIINSNIVVGDKSGGDRLNASYWDDLGDDVFDDWGYFYIYDVVSQKYYFPLFNPQNQSDGIITTQTFTVFGTTFTINHGWCVQGIFKFDISSNNSKAFRFGAYGNMGSDGSEFTENLTQSYSIGSRNLTLYYHHHEQDGDSDEILYSYFVPKNLDENNEFQSYNAYYDGDDMSMMSKEITNGLIVYFSKTNDVKDWIINDLNILISSGKGDDTTIFSVEGGNVFVAGDEYVVGNILSKGTNLGKTTLTESIDDDNYTPLPSSIINGYFTSSNLNDNRNFIIPTAAELVAAIPNCIINTSFHFTINNVQSGNFIRTLIPNSSVTIHESCINTFVPENFIFSYIILITSITPSSETAIILQNCNPSL